MIKYANEILSKVRLADVQINPSKSKNLEDVYILCFSDGSKTWKVQASFSSSSASSSSSSTHNTHVGYKWVQEI